MEKPEFNLAELMEMALGRYVEELRQRAEDKALNGSYRGACRCIADEIEGRFLVKLTVEK